MESPYREGVSFLCLDTETNMTWSKLWCTYAGFIDEPICYYGNSGKQHNLLAETIGRADFVVGHNLIGFDWDVLRRLTGITIPKERCLDTLVLSRLYDPAIPDGHSLKAWGKRLGIEKMDFDVEDFDGGFTPEMGEYCERDVGVLHKLLPHLLDALKRSKFSEESIILEHETAHIIAQQTRKGFNFNAEAATDLWVDLSRKMKHIADTLQERYPPKIGRAHV